MAASSHAQLQRDHLLSSSNSTGKNWAHLLHLLHSTPVQQLVQQLVQHKGPMAEIGFSAPVSDAMRVMADHNATALAVAAPPGEWTGGGGSLVVEVDAATGAPRKQYVGVVTVMDALIHVWDNRFYTDVPARLRSPVGAVLGHSVEALTPWCVSPAASVYVALEALSSTGGAHAALVPVVSGMGYTGGGGLEVTEFAPGGFRMLTQTDLVEFLAAPGSPGRDFLAARTVAEAVPCGARGGDPDGDLDRDPVAVPAHLGLLAAVSAMWGAAGRTAAALWQPPAAPEDGASSVPAVTGAVGVRVVGSLSAEDLRGCVAETLARWCDRPVLEFLRRNELAREYGLAASAVAEEEDEEEAARHALPPARPPVTCSRDTSLAEAALLALERQVHRVWVTDDEGLLCGVLHLTDILRVVCDNHHQESKA